MIALWLFFLAVMAALADWYAVARNITWLRYSAKPLVIILLGIWLILQPLDFSSIFFIFLALLFSLAGDAWLLAPSRYFMAGLASFLLAHVSYIIAFNRHGLPPIILPVGLLLIFFIGLGIFIFPLIVRDIRKRLGTRKLQGAMLIYYIVLSLMAFSATSRLFMAEWEQQAAAFVAAGGLLFFFSDFLLAFDRFVRPVNQGRLVVHVSYHLGQFSLVLGFVRVLLMA